MIYNLKFSLNFFSFKFFTWLFIFCLFSTSFAENSTHDILKGRILYLLKTGKESNAFSLYQEYYKEKKCHDSELLEQIAVILIEQGFSLNDPEPQALAIFGAGISMNEKMLELLKNALSARIPQIQLIALNFLARLHHDDADITLNRAMSSDYLAIRLEAGIHLAEQKSPKIVGQLESLMQKVDPLLLPLFPQFFALIGTNDATKNLIKLLNHSDEKVRVQAILSIANHKRDDLLPGIRRLSTHPNVLQQEASAYAFGIIKDEVSEPRLETLSRSKTQNVRLSALQALYRLGQKQRREEIETIARLPDLYAIQMLSEMEGSEQTLKALSRHESLNVRINAVLALLKLKNLDGIEGLMEILIRDSRDIGLIETVSPGGALKYLKAVPSASQNFKDDEMLHEMTLHMREQILVETINLPENDFLKIASRIFESGQNELIPILVALLENLETKDAISLLKFYQQKAGAPLIRNYCNLSLFRLKEIGPYRENLEKFIMQEYKTDLIQFRPLLPFEMRKMDSNYTLTPHDTSKLLVESFEAITTRQDEAGINLLLYVIEHGNSNNKYALAGLLMHATR